MGAKAEEGGASGDHAETVLVNHTGGPQGTGGGAGAQRGLTALKQKLQIQGLAVSMGEQRRK